MSQELIADRVSLLMTEIFENSSHGHHMLTTVQDAENHSIRFSIPEDKNFVFNFPEDMAPLEFEAMMVYKILRVGYSGLTMRSILPNGITELRGWIIEYDKITIVPQEDLITAYLTDFDTGNIAHPDPNIAYCDSWN